MKGEVVSRDFKRNDSKVLLLCSKEDENIKKVNRKGEKKGEKGYLKIKEK